MSFLRLIIVWIVVVTASPVEAAPSVVVSIKPIHSLVAGVMDGIGVPVLLLEGNNSPHDTSLRPSQARALQDADLIFWVGPELETFLSKPIANLSSLSKARNLLILDGLSFPKKQDGLGRDPHIWLDTQNALVIVRYITKSLVKTDPQNAARYLANEAGVSAKIIILELEMNAAFAPLQTIPYLTFHDAYGHLVHRFGLTKGLAFTNSPEHKPSAARIAQLQKQIRKLNIHCVFSEPQFDPKTLQVLTESPKSKISILDPLGSGLPKGIGHYFSMMREITTKMATCLTLK